MIQLRLRTEYSFRRAFGRVSSLVDLLSQNEDTAMAITDNGTWGHVDFFRQATRAGIKPILGVEVNVVPDIRERVKHQGRPMAFLATNAKGLREIYALITRAGGEGYFYYEPRIDYGDVNALSRHVIILTGAAPDLSKLKRRANVYLELNPGAGPWNEQAVREKGWQMVVCNDNYFVTQDDRNAYEILLGNLLRGGHSSAQRRTTPMHVMSLAELRSQLPMAPEEAFINTDRIAAECNAKLPRATMVKFPDPVPLRTLCNQGAKRLGIDLRESAYRERLKHELGLINGKGYADYFYVIADMVNHAKQRMLVGPGRGSSSGSLVCYLAGITDIDPIRHGLMFERFIDVTRDDLPDIDIDFPDTRREEVMAHLVEQYGQNRVGHLGTVNRYKAKSALNDVASGLGIPLYELKDFTGAIIERSSGDARAELSIMDAFNSLDVGKELLAKYPSLTIAADLEGHARHHGTHAAGYIVAERPIGDHCTIDRSGTAQITKGDAEALGILKIDALGLRTLTVLQACLDLIGKDRDWLIAYPLDDKAAFKVLNDERFWGIFQYEGYALQILTRQMGVENFDDVSAIGALARPGPLHSGAASDFVARRTGKEPVEYLHKKAIPFTRDTYGLVVYQEQVMMIGRAIGGLSWEDVNQLRRAMSKSLGEEFFNTYWEKFRDGAKLNKIPSAKARAIWEQMMTFGSWAFNKSHAVSYGMISYWCCVLKAHWPLEFTAAALQHAKDNDQATKLLRELVKSGFEYTPVDPEVSGLGWEVREGKLIGGLTNIRGIGIKKAQKIIADREASRPLTPKMKATLANPVTPFDEIFEAENLWGDYYRNPRDHLVHFPSGISYIRDIHDDGEYVFIGRLKEKNLRDVNEYQSVVARGGRLEDRSPLFLNLLLEDDTGSIIATIGRFQYDKMGKRIVEEGKIGDWYLWKGIIRGGWRKVKVGMVRRLSSK